MDTSLLRDDPTNGGANGTAAWLPVSKRFSDVPTSIDIPVQDQDDEAVEIDLTTLVDDPSDLCDLFENERAARTYWMAVSLAYAKQDKVDHAIEMLIRGSNHAIQNHNPKEKLSIVSCLCWMYLWKSRKAPRVASEGVLASEAKTKEYYLQLATSSLNEASRINPGFPPLFLARGVVLLLRASLLPPKSSGPGTVDSEKAELLRQAVSNFDSALKVSSGRNMLAIMGKARATFSLGEYPKALALYQDVLSKMPDLVDPDPRIGIGCCFWQLGFKEDAKSAWERCLEINPNCKISLILVGLYYLDASRHQPTSSPEFLRLYKKAMTEFTQKSFKQDKDLPLTCATFAGYFLSRKSFANVDSLAHKAIQYTDVNAVASDGWYLLARKEHYEGNLAKAADYYRRADDARGGTDRGYLPAKFGAAQLSVLKNDLSEAKLRLEKMIQQSKNYEAMALLGTLYAEEVFANQNGAIKEDKSAEAKKAIGLLESVRSAWKDPKKQVTPDASVLLSLARLFESDQPDKALQCLLQVEQLEISQIPESEYPTDIEDDEEKRKVLRKFLPPQLLNNIGCFYSQAEKHALASEMFQAALSACISSEEKNQDVDTDALVTTISYNLGRSYEAQSLSDDAIQVYEGLLARHDDYTDAKARLAYIKLRKNPNKEGPDMVAKLYQENPADLEVRALYGWLLGRIHSRKRPANINEDAEMRHHKHTLQNYDKHDRYALVAMGNLYLATAREMRRESDTDKQKRGAMYSKSVEFFEKALQLDPKNAYAAQGIAIALVEDKKDLKAALPIFLNVRDTLKDTHVFVNLGHLYADLRQFFKAIESYETALSKEGKSNDPNILACLGRTWLNKGRAERDLDAYKKALECAKKALEAAPGEVHFQFNVAFVQIQLATTIYALNETQRTSQQLEDAAAGLEEAIESLDKIASHPHTPYPKHDMEQRANMARNTQRKQLERAIASQKEYEEKNKERLAAALEQRQAELRRREDARLEALQKEKERQEKIRKEREEISARDRQLADQRVAEERAKLEADLTTDSETGYKVKRKRKAPKAGEESRSKGLSRKKKSADDGDESEEEEQQQPKKKRRLASKKESAKYKSAEIVVDSDEDDAADDALERAERDMGREDTPDSDGDDGHHGDNSDQMDVDNAADDDDDGEAVAPTRQQTKRSRRGRILDESDEDEEQASAKAASDDDVDAPVPAVAADTSMADPEDEDEE